MSFNKIKFAKIGLSAFILSRFHKKKSKQYLARELSKLPGLPTKFSQLLSKADPDLLEQSSEKTILDISEVKSILLKESPNLFSAIEEIADLGKSASLGQVHWAKVFNGDEVAIKVQYPGVRECIQSDLNLILSLFKRSPVQNLYQFDENKYLIDFSKFFSDETNYLKEAETQEAWLRDWEHISWIKIPKIYLQYSTESVLCQEFVSSSGLSEIALMPIGDRREVSTRILSFFARSIFETKRVHADLHAKNWGYNFKNSSLVIYDFGSTLILTENQSAALTNFLNPHLTEDESYKIWVDLGFDANKVKKINKKLFDLHRAVISYFFDHHSFSQKGATLSVRIESILGEDKWWFRSSGPPWFLLWMRSFSSVLNALVQLDASLDFQSVCSPWLSYNKYEKNNKLIFNDELEKTKTVLKVVISEHSVNLAQIEMPARAVLDLEYLVPEEALLKMKELGFSINEIKEKALNSNLKPQSLFEFKDGVKNYRVWLETHAST